MESPVKAIIWDMDHTLYHAPTIYVPGIPLAILKVLQGHGVTEPLTEADIVATIETQLKLKGTSYPYFEQRYGITHAAMAEGVAAALSGDAIEIDARLPYLFASHPQRHAVNTHASPAWYDTVVKRLAIAPYISAVIYHADHDFKTKCTSDATHRAALDALGIAAAEVLMVDDTAKNLRIPKELGMQTVLIDYGRTATDASFIDARAKDAAAVFDLLAA